MAYDSRCAYCGKVRDEPCSENCSGERAAPAAITAESLWNNNEVMSLNAELGLTMNQLLKLIRAAVRQD